MINEFVKLLRQPGYNRFVLAWKEKYQSIGHLGGSIRLNRLSKEEEVKLSLLLSRPVEKNLSISYVQFIKCLQGTKYEDIDFYEVLLKMYGPIQTNKEKKEAQDKNWNNQKQDTLNEFEGTTAYAWLKENLSNTSELDIVRTVAKGINQLPCLKEEYELLPVFAQKITGNPHYFDKGREREILLRAIEYILEIEGVSRNPESINQIFYKAGIIKDDLSNYCYITHILPKDSLKWKLFYQEYEPWNVNLYNVLHENKEYSISKVIVIENPSIFRNLTEYIKEKELEIGLVCSNGQLNFCTYVLLDRLYESGCQLYYCGDYDPEGLLIAQKVIDRYPLCTLWNYSVENMQKYGNKQEDISSKRLESLHNLTNPLLIEIGNEIKEKEMVCYQESLLELYYQNIV